jgi:hypothetical protein
MADLAGAIRMLEEHRIQLVEQLDAINRAIAALKGTDRAGARAKPLTVAAPATPAAGRVPTRRRRHITLSEEHKRKLVEGRRRAREARAVLATASDSEVPSNAGWKGDGPPRLIKNEL